MLTITKNDIENWLKELEKTNRVIDARKEILPFKQYFLPAKEKVFSYDCKKKKAKEVSKPEDFILFGLNMRDTEALIQLDEIMTKPRVDYFYLQKRQKAVVVSLIEENGPLPHLGIDLILEELNSGQETYKAHALTKKGKKLTQNKFFHNQTTCLPDRQAKQPDNQTTNAMPDLNKLLLDPEILKDAVEWSWKNMPDLWEKLGKQCLGCGICTYVCPLCYCFSMENKCDLSCEKCERKRTWTACTLPEFATITGGHDFHPSIKERYYNWFYHKFVRAYKEYGKSQCVACGRCKKYCPAGIDIEKILMEICKTYTSPNK